MSFSEFFLYGDLRTLRTTIKDRIRQDKEKFLRPVLSDLITVLSKYQTLDVNPVVTRFPSVSPFDSEWLREESVC